MSTTPPKSDSAAPETPPITPPLALPVARPLRRIAALVYDLFLLAAISLAYAAVFFVIQVFTHGEAATQILIDGQETTRLEYKGPLRSLPLWLVVLSRTILQLVLAAYWTNPRHENLAYLSRTT